MKRILMFLFFTLFLVSGAVADVCIDPLCMDGAGSEYIQDTTSTMIQNGTGITWAYDDGAGTLTPTVTTDLSPYALLDGSNGPTTGVWGFGDDLRGPVSGCTDATTLTLDGAPGSSGGIDYDVDVISEGACASGKAVAVTVEEGFGDGLILICLGEAAPNVLAMWSSSYFTYGVDNVRLCSWDVFAIFGAPGMYISFMIPSSDTCAALMESILEGPGGPTPAIDDAAWFSYNSETCSYEFTGTLGTIPTSWPDPPTVTTDAVPSYAWSISDIGDFTTIGDISTTGGLFSKDGTLTGDLGVGGDATITGDTQINGRLAFGFDPDLITDDSAVQGILSRTDTDTRLFVSRWDALVTNDTVPRTTSITGVYGSATYSGSQTLQTSMNGLAFAVVYNGSSATPPTGGIVSVLTTMEHAGTGPVALYTGVTPIFKHPGTGAVGTIRYHSLDEAVDPQGTVAAQMGFWCPELSNADVNIGVNIEAFPSADANDWGIKNDAPSYFGTARIVMPDLPAESGTTENVCWDTSTGTLSHGAVCN